MKYLLLFFLVQLIAVNQSAVAKANSPKKVRLLIWWDFLDPQVSKKLRDAGFDLDITTYKSNEVGLSKLASKGSDFDLAVVSSLVLPQLTQLGKIEHLAKNFSQYEPFLEKLGSNCVPYFWSSTVFGYDSRSVKSPPGSFEALLRIKSDHGKIAVLDDPYEVAGRILGDRESTCGSPTNSKNVFATLNACKAGDTSWGDVGFVAEDFRSSLKDIYLDKRISAFYGWHGEIAELLGKAPWLKINPALKNSVIGADFVCLLANKNRPNKDTLELKKFISLLTDRQSTEINARYSQYFSPYKGDDSGLLPPVKELRTKIAEKIKASNFVVLLSPETATHRMINNWWQKIRYAH